MTTQTTEMAILVRQVAVAKSPRTKFNKPKEGELEPVEVAVITLEVPMADLEEQRDAIKTLAMYAHQGYPVRLTVTAEQAHY